MTKEPWQMTQDEYATEETVKALKGKPELSEHKLTIWKEYAARHSQAVKLAILQGKKVSPDVLEDYPEYLQLLVDTLDKKKKRKFPLLPVPALDWLPEYVGSSPKSSRLTITKIEAVEAINKARRHVPGEWQAEVIEIAMIPKVWEHLHKLSSATNDSLKRVEGGYVLEDWNSPDRPWVGTAFDGLRRYFHTNPIQGIRMLVHGKKENVNLPAIEQWLQDSSILFHNVGGHKPRKPKPLPPEAISPQTLPFNSEEATCYGKRDKRGSFRVYCRIKKG